MDKYKARLTAKGYTQQVDVGFSDTFSSVAKLTSMRVLLVVATTRNWCLQQLDFNNVFLNEICLRKFIWTCLKDTKPLLLVLYANSISPCMALGKPTGNGFASFLLPLLQQGFIQSKNNYSLFTCGFESLLVVLLVYVDNIILAGPSSSCAVEVQTKLQSMFKLKVLGYLKYFLGLELSNLVKEFHLLKESTHYHC